MLELFHTELMAVDIGNEDYDWHALEAESDYKNGYSSNDQVVIIISFVIHFNILPSDNIFFLYYFYYQIQW